MFSGWFKSEEKPKIDPSKFHKPDHYRGEDGPEFKVLESKPSEYEVRLYRKTQWAKTRAEGSELPKCARQCVFKLFDYNKGKNEGGIKIASTKPLRIQVERDEEGNFKAITVAFFTPHELHDKPPVPKDEGITFVTDELRVIYARSFTGFAKDQDWLDNAKKLQESLERDGKGFVKEGLSYRAGHDPPTRLMNRHNEVWLVADPQPSGEELAALVQEEPSTE